MDVAHDTRWKYGIGCVIWMIFLCRYWVVASADVAALFCAYGMAVRWKIIVVGCCDVQAGGHMFIQLLLQLIFPSCSALFCTVSFLRSRKLTRVVFSPPASCMHSSPVHSRFVERVWFFLYHSQRSRALTQECQFCRALEQQP